MEVLSTKSTPNTGANGQRIAINSRGMLTWLGRTELGTITQVPDTLAAQNNATSAYIGGKANRADLHDVPHADVYHFRPDSPRDGHPETTRVVPAEIAEATFVAAAIDAALREPTQMAA